MNGEICNECGQETLATIFCPNCGGNAGKRKPEIDSYKVECPKCFRGLWVFPTKLKPYQILMWIDGMEEDDA